MCACYQTHTHRVDGALSHQDNEIIPAGGLVRKIKPTITTAEQQRVLASKFQKLRCRAKVVGSPIPLVDYVNLILQRRREYQTLPVDGLFSLPWDSRNDGTEKDTGSSDIGVTEVWGYTRGDPATFTAVMDERFELDHRKIGADDRIVSPLMP